MRSLAFAIALMFVTQTLADNGKEQARAKATALLLLRHQPAHVQSIHCQEDLQAASAQAMREHKFLFVWVGGCDGIEAVRDQFPEGVHCHAQTYKGSSVRRLVIPTNQGDRVWPRDRLEPAEIRQLVSPCSTPIAAAEEIRWEKDYAAATTKAVLSGDPLFVYVSSGSCIYCKKMEAGALSDPEVVKLVNKRFVAAKVKDAATARKLGVHAFPTTIIDGKAHVGCLAAGDLRSLLK